MAQEKKFQYSLATRAFRVVMKLFYKKPKIICLCDTLENQAIYISNHSSTSGPIGYVIRFPKIFQPWGTYEMNGTRKERWNYMYHIFYRHKKKKGKVYSFIMASIISTLSKIFYNGVHLLPTYGDLRMVSTIKSSMKSLDNNVSIMIFPEDSMNGGYKTILEKYHPGFVTLATRYAATRNIDLPIYTVYYSKQVNTIVIDKPETIKQYTDQNMTKEEIAELFLKKTNDLYFRYILPLIAKGKVQE